MERKTMKFGYFDDANKEYVRSYFEALHTTGEKYIVNDIDLFIEARQSI